MVQLQNEFLKEPRLWNKDKIGEIAKFVCMDESLIKLWCANRVEQCWIKYGDQA